MAAMIYTQRDTGWWVPKQAVGVFWLSFLATSFPILQFLCQFS